MWPAGHSEDMPQHHVAMITITKTNNQTELPFGCQCAIDLTCYLPSNPQNLVLCCPHQGSPKAQTCSLLPPKEMFEYSGLVYVLLHFKMNMSGLCLAI